MHRSSTGDTLVFYRLVSTIAVSLALASTSFVFAHEPEALPEIVVKEEAAQSDAPLVDRGAILYTERLPKKRIEKKHAQTLSEAVAGETGVDSQTSCANCGSKRVTINGLRGEHTTILVDGVPLHSAVSSFYGVDAVPMAGVEAIEITRGAGASLTAPEAIGGVLNIITESPTRAFATADLQGGNNGNWLFSGAASELFLDGKFRVMGAGQFARQGLWDVDGNQVADSPDFTNGGVLFKSQIDLGKRDGLEFRYAWQRVSVLGGTVNGTRPTTYLTTVTPPAFESNDVSRRYLDSQEKITDVIGLTRHEAVARWKHKVGDVSQLQFTSSAAWQRQESIYFHGYDYSNKDLLSFGEAKFNSLIDPDHVLAVGVDGRYQSMSSQSEKLYSVKGLAPDDFRFKAIGLFGQDTWSLNAHHELALAARFDWLSVEWPFQGSRKVNRLLVSPRIHWKWMHSANFTSRFSYGRGYRAPLSFFESQHGLSEDGFTIGLTEIETAHTLGYSAHYLNKEWEWGGGVYGTLLENAAYALEPEVQGDSAVFRNYPDSLGIVSSYVSSTYKPGDGWKLEGSLEDFRLPAAFKRLLPVAITEQRARILVEKTLGNWEAGVTANIIGARDLAPYRYDQHYRTWGAVLADPGNPGLGTSDQVIDKKRTSAPLYATFDVTIGYHPVHDVELSFSVLNVTDFTQTGAGDSPLAWGQHGASLTHFHLDNMHVWGPLRGRTFLLGLKASL